MLHVDIPTRGEVRKLAAHRERACVTIVLPSTPITHDAQSDRTVLGNLGHDALDQLAKADIPNADIAAIGATLSDIIDDDDFWRFQARSLVIFVTPSMSRSYRVPNHLTTAVEVSDRFHLTPLLRAITFPHHAMALVLGQNAVRVIEVQGNQPTAQLHVPNLPRSAADVARKASIHGRSPKGRLQGSEGQKFHMQAYARRVDEALHPILMGSNVPLAVMAVEPLRSIFLSLCKYDTVLTGSVAGISEHSTDGEVAGAVRQLLDLHYASEVEAVTELYHRRSGNHRTTTDVADAARAATFGSIDTLLVDMDAAMPGTIDEDGIVDFADTPDAASYNVLSELACRALMTGAHVISARQDDIPDRATLAAILRRPV